MQRLMLADLFKECFDLRNLTHVGRDQPALRAVGLDLVQGFLRLLCVAQVMNKDVIPSAGQLYGGRPPDATGSTRDQGYLSRGCLLTHWIPPATSRISPVI